MTVLELGSKVLDVRGALREAMQRLRKASVPSHTLAAELLLMHVLGRDRAWLYAHPEEVLDGAVVARYLELVARRAEGVPTQYLTGKQEFWGLEFEVTPAVLIPRPETEHVVEVVLERLGPTRSREPLRIADLGTGSGCLAVALARELPSAHVIATDTCAAALRVAQRNAARNGVSKRVRFVRCSLLEAFASVQNDAPVQLRRAPLDLVVSNPPYVGREESDSLQREVRDHEPAKALFAGWRGHELYASLIDQAKRLLPPSGLLVLELGYNSLEAVSALVGPATGWTQVRVSPDLAGIPRVLAAGRA